MDIVEETLALQVVEVKDDAELLLNSVMGFSTLGTLKMKRQVIILIDCGATNHLQLYRPKGSRGAQASHDRYGALWSDYGYRINNIREGCVQGVILTIAKLTIVEDFLPLELGGVEVVLGIQWLQTLGITKVDWRALTMTVGKGQAKITLKGDPSLTKAKVTVKKQTKAWEDTV